MTEKEWLHGIQYLSLPPGVGTYGGIRDISVLEPLPGLVGFIKVVSIRVHPSPLKPQPPREMMVIIILVNQWNSSFTCLKIPVIFVRM